MLMAMAAMIDQRRPRHQPRLRPVRSCRSLLPSLHHRALGLGGADAGEFAEMRFELRGLVVVVEPIEAWPRPQRIQHAHTIAARRTPCRAVCSQDTWQDFRKTTSRGLDRRRHDLREQPDAADQQRLVDQVEGEAVAADEEQRIGPAAGRRASPAAPAGRWRTPALPPRCRQARRRTRETAAHSRWSAG